MIEWKVGYHERGEDHWMGRKVCFDIDLEEDNEGKEEGYLDHEMERVPWMGWKVYLDLDLERNHEMEWEGYMDVDMVRDLDMG